MLLPIDELRYARFVRGLVLAGLLCSLSASTYFFMYAQTTREVVKDFRYGGKHYERVRPEWRPRIGAISLVRAIEVRDDGDMRVRIAGMYALLFFATGLVYLLLDPRATPLLLLGTFAALYYCGTPIAENAWYPWDMPALFFSALTLWLAVRRETWTLALAILLGVTFKETLLLMALLFLFYEGRSREWRAGFAVATVALGCALRLGIEQMLGGVAEHGAFLHLWGDPSREYRFVDNLRFLFSIRLNHVAFVNVGLVLLVFLIPTNDPVLRGVKLVTAVFYLGLLLAGSFNEFRVFLEALPGTLLLLHGLFDGVAPKAPWSGDKL